MDKDPDLSHYGKFSDKWEEGAILRPMINWRGLRFFVPNDFENAEVAEASYKRMEEYNNSLWYMIGIKAVAEVYYRVGNTGRLEWLSSGGLWGIESDSGEEYLKGIEDEELVDLKAHLEMFGVDTSEFERIAREGLER